MVRYGAPRRGGRRGPARRQAGDGRSSICDLTPALGAPKTCLRRGAAVYTFDLSDGTATVYVTVFATKPLCQSGAVVVEGTFGQTKWRVNASHSFKEITARTVTCLPERRANCRLMTRRTLKTHDGPAHESHRPFCPSHASVASDLKVFFR